MVRPMVVTKISSHMNRYGGNDNVINAKDEDIDNDFYHEGGAHLSIRSHEPKGMELEDLIHSCRQMEPPSLGRCCLTGGPSGNTTTLVLLRHG